MVNEFPFLESIITNFKKASSGRYLVGIIGAPGSGKSTLAANMVQAVNKYYNKDLAAVFNMDGYHYYNDYLLENEIHPYKGAHFTFNVKQFIEKLIEIKEVQQDVLCPIYSREIHNPVENANLIKANHKMVFVEGNYLLTHVFPWSTIKYILDYTVYLDVSHNVQFKRLKERHMAGGKKEIDAIKKINNTDLPNSIIVEQTKNKANIILKPSYNF